MRAGPRRTWSTPPISPPCCLMKERGLLKPFKSPAMDAVSQGTARSRRHLDHRSADPGCHPVQHEGIRLSAARRPGPISARPHERPPCLLLQPLRRWRAAPLHTGQASWLGPRQGLAATKPLRVQTPQVIAQVLERGERGAGFLQNDNIAWRSKLQGKPTDYVFPAEGVPTEIGACGLLKSSTRPHAAALYYEWWMGAEGQAILVKGGKYSSRTDVAPPEGSTPLSKLKLLTLDYAEYEQEQSQDPRPDGLLSSAASGATDDCARHRGIAGRASYRVSQLARRRPPGAFSPPVRPPGCRARAGRGAAAVPGRLSAAVAVPGRARRAAVDSASSICSARSRDRRTTRPSSTRCNWRSAPAS